MFIAIPTKCFTSLKWHFPPKVSECSSKCSKWCFTPGSSWVKKKYIMSVLHSAIVHYLDANLSQSIVGIPWVHSLYDYHPIFYKVHCFGGFHFVATNESKLKNVQWNPTRFISKCIIKYWMVAFLFFHLVHVHYLLCKLCTSSIVLCKVISVWKTMRWK